MLRFTAEFGMESGGSKALLSPGENGAECFFKTLSYEICLFVADTCFIVCVVRYRVIRSKDRFGVIWSSRTSH